MSLDANVEHHKHVTGHMYRETPECGGENGWAAAAEIMPVRFEIEDGRLMMQVASGVRGDGWKDEAYAVPPPLLEAALKLYQDWVEEWEEG